MFALIGVLITECLLLLLIIFGGVILRKRWKKRAAVIGNGAFQTDSFFASYLFKSDKCSGEGCINLPGKGLFSWNDLCGASKFIENKLLDEGKVSDDISVVIIYWRRYD